MPFFLAKYKVITVPITEPLSYALKMSKYYLMAMPNPMSM